MQRHTLVCVVFVIVAIVASRVCLRSVWTQWALIVSTIPIAIFKNAVRIVVISTLSAYVECRGPALGGCIMNISGERRLQ
jgi:exosortase/archaeosortase family protein